MAPTSPVMVSDTRFLHLHRNLDGGRKQPAQVVGRVADHLPQIYRLQLHRSPPAEGHQLPDQLDSSKRRPLQLGQFGSHVGTVRRDLAGQERRVGDHDREQIVEVMRDATGQLADRFHLLRLPELFTQVLSFGHVFDQGDPTIDRAIRVTSGRSAHPDIDARSVAPASHHLQTGKSFALEHPLE